MITDSDAVVREKFSALSSLLREMGSAVLAFSGGVDSTFLLSCIRLAGLRYIAVTSASETTPREDLEEAIATAREAGADHRIVKTDELADEAFSSNPPDRCFHCKDRLFRTLRQIADQEGIPCVVDGTNADDLADYRPGRRAALLHGVMSPLAQCSLTKAEIRELSRTMGLRTWDRPASPCLSSRFPYGQRITPEEIRKVESAEQAVKALGVQTVRVRNHGDIARVEVGEGELHFLLDAPVRKEIVGKLRALGFRYVALDLEGYRSGSLNRFLEAS